MRKFIALLALSLVGLFSTIGAANAYTITLNPLGQTNLQTFAKDPGSGFAVGNKNPGTLPFVDTSTSVNGGATSESSYGLHNSVFNISFDHTRSDIVGSRASSTGNIYFKSDTDITFSASGAYSVLDSVGRKVSLNVYLYDFTAGSYLFRSNQVSQSTANESFVLGGIGGDSINTSFGSLVGQILAGNVYAFHYEALIENVPAGSVAGATALGSIQLLLIPEPGTAVLMSFGLVGLGVSGSRRRRAA